LETDGQIALPVDRAIWFGPFCLRPAQQLLLEADIPIRIGARALDLLIALVERAGEVMTKDELVARVWPNLSVDEGNLRTQMALVRKALRDGQAGARYLITVPGRGYRFVAPLSAAETPDLVRPQAFPAESRSGLPTRLTRLIGRADAVRDIAGRLNRHRCITVIGPGGIGKTSVALAVAEQAATSYDDGICVVDCAPLLRTSLVARKLASTLGLEIAEDDPTRGLVAFLRTRRMLIVLDSCERVVEAAAVLVENLLKGAAGVDVLATSREPLRAEGEGVYRLPPLEIPPVSADLSAADALTYAAVELFVERAASSVDRFELSDTDAPVVARICHKLDGIALAIELAAGRVDVFGLLGVAARLDDRIRLLTHGRRTALQRHQTLGAALDWSYDVLPGPEQTVLRRLAVFAGGFTIDAADAVAADDLIDITEVVASLVSKSLLSADVRTATGLYRLLDTTRAYASKKLVESGEFDQAAGRHAKYIRNQLDTAKSSTARRLSTEAAPIDEVRLAIDWAFSPGGDVEAGIALTVAAAPAFLAMSLFTECHRWAERAILALDAATRAGNEEMHLQAALGLSLMFTRGGSEGARLAFNKSLAIAEERGDTPTQLRVLSMLHMFHGRIGDPRTALQYARRCSAVSKTIADPAALTLGHSLLGMSLHFTGDLSGARMELEAALRYGPGTRQTSTAYLGFNGHILVGGALARTLWLQGHPAQAVERAHQTVKDAASTDHPVTLSIALIWAITVLLWSGDLRSAEEHIDWFVSRAEAHSLAPYLAIGRGFKGELAIRRGDAKSGVEALRGCLEDLHAARHELLITPFNISLVQGLSAIGRFAEGTTLIDETIILVEAQGDFCYMPELLRVKGNLLLATPRPMDSDAKMCFTQSLEWSQRQAALAWELRTAVDLAALLAAQGQLENARALLLPVFMQFMEGSETADLKAAERLLATLG
jgi:predicted ATPase/DNA-binding winged helix-turn-helix (wHTH) protein